MKQLIGKYKFLESKLYTFLAVICEKRFSHIWNVLIRKIGYDIGNMQYCRLGGEVVTRIIKLWNSVFFRFTGAFIIVGLIPLIMLSVFSLQSFTNHVQQYTLNNLSQMTMYMSYNVDNAFNQYNEIAKLMYYNKNSNATGEIIDQTRAVNVRENINQTPIHEFLKTIILSDPYIKSAYFVRTFDKKMYYETEVGTAFFSERLPIDDWMNMFEEDITKLVVTLPHDMDYFYNDDSKVVTIGRNLIDISEPITSTRKVVGTLFFDVDIRMFEEMFSELQLSHENDELYVKDQSGYVYYSNKKEHIGTKIEQNNFIEEGRIKLSQSISSINGTLEIRISSAGLFEQLSKMRSAVYIVIIICMIIIVVLGIWFSRYLSSPIKSVIRQMTIMESGNLNVRIKEYGKDEIGRLAHGFNRMVEHLNEFIKDAYVAELGRKQAELNALKSQIRPHYLYNTLEVIRMNAVHNDDSEVADMILSLSNQLKYVIDYGEDWVSIQRELDHLRNYFYIIKVSYENRIELKIEQMPNVDLNWKMLKLILQPLVENAVQHGIRPNGGKGTIKIRLEAAEDDMQVTVFDDGVGMDEDKLLQLRNTIEGQQDTGKGVGLKNVHERIRTTCGSQYGLRIDSRKHVGTSITMFLPIKREEDTYED